MKKIVIMGQGYVGLPLAMLAAEAGNTVVGFDVSEERVKRLCAGESFVEDIAPERLASALASGNYRPTTDEKQIDGFDVAVISVPTPLREGAPDLRHIESATGMVGRFLRRGATVVLESTTYPGTTEELVAPILEESSGLTAGEDFQLGYSPERIDPGNRTWTLDRTPKVVSGVNEKSLAAVDDFYGGLIENTVPVGSTRVAELTKLVENTFRHVNIALVNELAIFARELGIDVWEAIDTASTKPFGFMRFTPGPGVGGHCLPVDPVYLSWRVNRALGQRFRFVELANDVNDHMPGYVVQRLISALNERRMSVNGARVLVLGLAYKPDTGDARESPAVRVIEAMLRMGAKVRAVDPHVVEPIAIDDRVMRAELVPEEIEQADAVLLITDHSSFDYELVVEHAPYVLDCRRRLPAGPTVEYL
ncbi:nucleotide sugar dehydrogenase [Streptomyces sp. CMB-StM0423]|uniref:nucleotide sugar dehydrogenase n=1 Tax=Streptomyces sp. CMB-StM0423 TaxID=2059884 RepID=UPI000C70EB8E|nr:nucleotide sugar dehydrogenase [Streptomyces sp. CMB-StM0423]AUH43252.1 nucleotide sugar dehydrogenase [Streptomyces sp. CMB-StM0423]